MPGYIELERHVGTLVDELREDCTRIEICLQSGQNRRQKDKRNGAAISGQPLAILSSAAVPQFYLVSTISKPIMQSRSISTAYSPIVDQQSTKLKCHSISKCNPHHGRHNRHSKTFQILHSASIPQDQPQQNPDTIQPIPVQSKIHTQSGRNYSTNVPENIELERRPGTSVKRLHQHVAEGQIETGLQFLSKRAGNPFGHTLKHAKFSILPFRSTAPTNQTRAARHPSHASIAPGLHSDQPSHPGPPVPPTNRENTQPFQYCRSNPHP